MKEDAKSRSKYEILWSNLPGAVNQCLNDKALTIVDVNQCFIEMFGFTREELSERFDNSFMNMVHPNDRESVFENESVIQNKGEKFKAEYRVICRDGSYKWVIDNAQMYENENGEERFLCILLEVPGSIEAKEELRLSMERFEIIMSQSADIIIEWNILEDTFTFSPNWEKKFGYAPQYAGENCRESNFRHIHPDDMAILEECMRNAKEGRLQLNAELRIQNAEGKYTWCRARLAGQSDRDGKMVRVVGILTDIDKTKRTLDDLRRRAEQDALTGLYNREEAQRQIHAYLEDNPKEISALFMIDTDNFKQINDVQGHLFGDAVLSELAAIMKKLTRKSDVVGRIGGDEFTIFLKNISSREMAQEKANMLLNAFSHLLEGEKQVANISCSIGVAIYPDNGESFEALYHCADQALYQAKSRGKGQYVMYDTKEEGKTGFSALGAVIDSDQRAAGLPGDLVNYVFQVLYDTEDIDRAIQLILEIVGKRFDVSRAYIFENSDDGKFCNNTYEWCNVGIVPQKENLQHFSYEDIGDYQQLFKDNSVFYCRDIQALTQEQTSLFESQGIRSTLQCAIMEEDIFCGFVGFDECTGMRMWTKEEIGMLSLISQLLTTFLQKKRTTDRDRQMTLQLNTILDNQDVYIYAIEQDTYELLYLNHKTKELDPNAQTGMTCHKAFFGSDKPCKNCPLDGYKETYNPQYDVWTNTHVSNMKWGSRDAYLLYCYDITQYKKMQQP